MIRGGKVYGTVCKGDDTPMKTYTLKVAKAKSKKVSLKNVKAKKGTKLRNPATRRTLKVYGVWSRVKKVKIKK